jgi:hypothetical protein
MKKLLSANARTSLDKIKGRRTIFTKMEALNDIKSTVKDGTSAEAVWSELEEAFAILGAKGGDDPLPDLYRAPL